MVTFSYLPLTNTNLLIHGRYDRVHKMATDIDFFSMGNRMFGRQKRQIELFPDSTDPNQDNKSLAARIMRNDASAPEHAKKVLQRYFLTAGNEDEWGDIADQVGEAMLAIMIEYEVYSLVMEQKRALRDGRSIIGRINAHQKWLADTSPDKKPLSFMPTSYDATMDTDLASDEHTVNTEEQNRRDNEKRIALAEASKAAALLKQEEEEKEKQRRKQELREQSRRAEEAKERRKREKSAGNITTAQPVPPPRSSPTNRIILRNSSSLLQHGSSRELKAGSRGFDDGGLISDADNSVISGSSQSPKRSVQQNKVVGSSGKSETAESLVRSAATATISGSTLPSVNNTVRTPQNISRDSSWLGRRSDSPKRSTRPISPFLSTSLKRGIIAARPLNSVDNEIGNSHSNSNSMRALSRSPSHSERLRTDSQNSPYRRRVDTALAPVIDQQKAALALAAMPDFPGLSAPCQIDDSNSVEGYDSLESKSIGSGNRILVPVQRASSNASSKSGVGLGAHSDSQKREDGSRMRESRAEHSDASGSEKLPKSKSSRLPSL